LFRIVSVYNTIKFKDELVKSIIQQASAFNPTQEECKSFRDPNDPKFHIRREWATPHSLQM
jgi:hypothetical protein